MFPVMIVTKKKTNKKLCSFCSIHLFSSTHSKNSPAKIQVVFVLTWNTSEQTVSHSTFSFKKSLFFTQ